MLVCRQRVTGRRLDIDTGLVWAGLHAATTTWAFLVALELAVATGDAAEGRTALLLGPWIGIERKG